ncbi:TlpA disulfide reductase family protein [Mangrovimonas sp. DI 80]|uniref:TlpA disulfide reductase family protein n=1 Tax=Mangrovimonas sp. DI 80 TaxID=1779330 RepID=UPI0009784EC0|nr:TlpA disulfide reductase family protein [Mangrovimonas sp. DI 80]OMP30195.1 thioredoxin [Mangrovimonas sp. DI 80]
MKKILVFIALLGIFSCQNNKSKEPIAENNIVEKQPYALEVHNFDGIQPYLTSNDDKTYVVNFWATWCAPCVKELPYFEQLGTNFKDKNVEVILISLDFPNQYESKLIPFIEKNQLQSKVVALNDPDSNSWIPKVSDTWTGALPATLIFNAKDRKFFEKSFDYSELESELQHFIN